MVALTGAVVATVVTAGAAGAAETHSTAVYTFDCWKQILHDDSCEPSNGKTLNEIVMDPRIKQVTAMNTNDSELPQVILQNIWDEQFHKEYVNLPCSQLVAHALKM